MRYNRWVQLDGNVKEGKVLCVCDCGTERYVNLDNLKSGRSKSCGCYRIERVKQECITHGLTGTKTYLRWVDMKDRCYRVNSVGYENYGARGIKVCDRWLNSFENFLKDMGEVTTEYDSLERLDVNGDYCPENCVWIKLREQARNRRKLKLNTSGITGVRYDAIEERWRAFYSDPDNGKQVLKSFSISKYGYTRAKDLALKWREEKLNMLKSKGIGYGKNHGE